MGLIVYEKRGLYHLQSFYEQVVNDLMLYIALRTQSLRFGSAFHATVQVGLCIFCSVLQNYW